jgi:hypothetical protein
VISSHDNTQDFWLGATYARLVDDLIEGKRDQLDAYPDGRLVIASGSHGYLPALARQALSALSRSSLLAAGLLHVPRLGAGAGLAVTQ